MSTTNEDTDWSPNRIDQLRTLWGEGHSTAEIGRRLGVSKNAIAGKAHRLDLEARPSPIRRPGSQPTPRKHQNIPKLAELVPLKACAQSPDPAIRAKPAEAVAPQPPTPPIPPGSQSQLAQAPVSKHGEPREAPKLAKTTCCWPIGTPGTRSFRFCDTLALFGKPYCEDHAQVAYVRVHRPSDPAKDARSNIQR